jgi:cytochrome P450
MIDFDPYSQSFADDPYPVYKRLRDEAPVYHHEALKFYAISRYADVVDAHADFATYSSTGGVTIEDMGPTPLLITKDPPEHRWHKTLVTKVFSASRMLALGPFIQDLVTRLLDEAAEKDEFDFVQDFALEIPLEVISELIGIPKEMRRPFHELSNQMLARGEGKTDMEKTMAIVGQQVQMFTGLVQERRLNPREDPISHLIAAEVPDENGEKHRLNDFEMAFRFIELATAGHETVAKAIPNGATAFHRFPGERKKVTDNPGIMQSVVEEILRFDPPSQLQGRTTTRDVTLHGVTIPAGTRTMLLTGAATRDERKFENPDMFDVTRDAPLDAIFFGWGIHRCLGIHLARLEIRTAFQELFKRFPNFEVDPSRATRSVLSNVRGVNTLPARLGKAA